MIESNVIHAAYLTHVEKLLFLGTSCIYPKHAAQPIQENALLAGPLEPTNQWYAIAKIAGIRMCQAYRRQYGCNFIAAMPCNLYGPGDVYDAERSHVIPAMILKMHEAKEKGLSEISFWGTGTPLREFLYSDDLAAGLIHLLKSYEGEEHINIGAGYEVNMRDLADIVAEVTGYDGKIIFDISYPDGTPRKVMDNTRIRQSGWTPVTPLKDGVRRAYDDYLKSAARLQAA
jgi:GDP-L-fucose synthase